MTKFEDWPERLAAFIEARRHEPFARGTNCCVSFAADCVLELTGHDHLGEHRGAFTSDRAALRLLREKGGMRAMVSAALGMPRHPATAQRGDVVLVEMEEGESLTVCTGPHLAGPGRDGLQFLPLSAGLMRWSV